MATEHRHSHAGYFGFEARLHCRPFQQLAVSVRQAVLPAAVARETVRG
jgi:hypothetical protein